MKRLELLISGDVQDVGYRAAVVQEAMLRGLTGAVWNNANGSVGIIAEGAQDSLEGLLEWAHQGPPGAKVEQVDERWLKPSGSYQEFAIRR